MDIWYRVINLLPFSWVEYDFMKNALLAVIIITPFFGLIGTAVVSNRMAFFSDGIGHSALTGIALGVIAGFVDMQIPMILFAVIFALVINILMDPKLLFKRVDGLLDLLKEEMIFTIPFI